MRLACLVIALVVVCAEHSSLASQAATQEFARSSVEQLKAGIERQHPAAYYVLAGKLMESGARDEAVFWFYAGQLRYRFHLAANPDLPGSGDPALFASLSEAVGRPVNEYAFGDLPALTATIDKVLEWDDRTANGFTSKTTHAEVWKRTRGGLADMRAQVLARADEIRAQRTRNGLVNRTP